MTRVSAPAGVRATRLTLPCLSVRQPWAFALVHGFKDVENRDWSTKFRGPCLIHAGKREEKDEVEFVLRRIAHQEKRPADEIIALYDSRRALGAVVGGLRIVDCVEDMDSPWFCGRFGFVAEGAKPCMAVEMKGRLGFWDVTVDWCPAEGEDHD